jgi:hypothetical protein
LHGQWQNSSKPLSCAPNLKRKEGLQWGPGPHRIPDENIQKKGWESGFDELRIFPFILFVINISAHLNLKMGKFSLIFTFFQRSY